MNETCTISQKIVLLLRSPTEGDTDPYHQALEKDGYSPFSIPVLKFNNINTEKYSSVLSDYKRYHAVVFTSQQAVKVTQEVIQSWTEEEKTNLLKNLVCYVVGKATAKAARQLGFNAVGENSGNADILCDFIHSDRTDKESRAIFFPCSSIRKDTVVEKLSSEGINVEEICVYETIHREDIHEEIKELVQKFGKLFAVVFFSPSGVQAFKQNKLTEIDGMESAKMIAIGPSTKDALDNEGIYVFGTAKKPDPESIFDVLCQ